MAVNDVRKRAVITPFAIREFPSRPDSLGNAARTFQRFIDDVFGSLEFAQAYVNDWIIESPDRKSYLQHTNLVVERLRKHCITVYIQKYKIRTDPLNFLGNTIDTRGIRSLKNKVATILYHSEPTIASESLTFDGLICFHRWFISNLASLKRRLTNELRENSKIISSDGLAKKAFSTAK